MEHTVPTRWFAGLGPGDQVALEVTAKHRGQPRSGEARGVACVHS